MRLTVLVNSLAANQLVVYLLTYYRTYFHLKLYIATIILLLVLVYLNYTFNFERGFVYKVQSLPLQSLLFACLLAIPYVLTCLLLYYYKLNTTWLKNKEFWLAFIFIFAVAGFDRGINFLDYADSLKWYEKQYLTRVFIIVQSLILVVIPIFIYYYFVEFKQHNQRHYYGLAVKNSNLMAYRWLFLIVIMIIAASAMLNNLSSYYPIYARSQAAMIASKYNLPNWLLLANFQLFYGLTFFIVEIVFRGFLIIAFVRILGAYAVIPATVTYACLHFGKPYLECLSSIVGGYILGVITYYSKRIWGGILLHILLALSMELFSYIYK